MKKLGHRIEDLEKRRGQIADIIVKVRLSVGLSLRIYASQSNLTPEQIFDGVTEIPFFKFVEVCKEGHYNVEEKILNIVFKKKPLSPLTLDEFYFHMQGSN